MNLAKTIGAHALGESVEEVSEEVLLDLCQQLHNWGQVLRGDDAQYLKPWENMRDRYLLSAIGGAIGGGMATSIPGLGGVSREQIEDLKKMDVK